MSRRRFVASALAALAALSPVANALAAPAKKRKARTPARGASRKGTRKEAIGPGRANVKVAPSAPPPSPVELAEREMPQGRWRQYEVSSQFKLAAGRKPVRLWLPLPADHALQYQALGEHTWEGNAERVRILHDSHSGLHALVAEWADAANCQLSLNCKVSTRDRRFDITRRNQPVEAPDVLRENLASTPGMEIAESTRTAVQEIIVRLKDPLAQAHAIYDWVVDNTRYSATASSGSPSALLAGGAVAGSDTDINGAFVILARSAGIPARRVFGWRVDGSDIVPSLGQPLGSEPAPHCRAEFYVHGYGWIPADPADVRRALAADGGQLDSRKREVLRKLLFGFWEMNWISLGSAEAATLAAHQVPVGAQPWLVAPQLEVGGQPVALGDAVRVQVRAPRSA